MSYYSLKNINHDLDDGLIVSCGIYAVFSPSGRVYVGQSLNIRNRWYLYSKEYCKGQPRLYRSIKKYGANNHKYITLHHLPIDVGVMIMNEYEKFYIGLFKDAGVPLLNLDYGGTNFKRSPETALKISAALRGKKLSPDHIAKLKKAQLGTKRSPEHIRKAVESRKKNGKPHHMKGKTQPAHWVEKRRQKMIGLKLGFRHSEETKKKISKSKLNNPMVYTQEMREAAGARKRGIPRTQEDKIKIGAAIRAAKQKNPIYFNTFEYLGAILSLTEISRKEKVSERELRYLVVEKREPLGVRSAILYIKSNPTYSESIRKFAYHC